MDKWGFSGFVWLGESCFFLFDESIWGNVYETF